MAQVGLLLDRSGATTEFASRIGVTARDLTAYLDGIVSRRPQVIGCGGSSSVPPTRALIGVVGTSQPRLVKVALAPLDWSAGRECFG